MEEVGASTQPRLQFSRGTLSDIPGASVSPREKYCNSTISGEHIFSGVVSTRSSIFTADRFSDNSDGCYSSGPSTVQRYLKEFWVLAPQMWEAYIPFSPRILPHLQWWLQRSNLLTGVPLDPLESTLTLYSLHRCIPNMTGCLPRRGNSVRGVGRLSFRRTHTSSGNEGSSTVIETLPVVVYLQNQGGTHSFSLHLLCREIILLCDGLQTVLTVRHVPGNLNLIADALSRFRVPVNTKWELHPVIFQAITLIWGSPPDRSVCHQFELQTGDIQPESLGRGCNDHDYKLCYLNVIMVAYLLLNKYLP